MDAAIGIADPAPTPEERAMVTDAGQTLRSVFGHLSPDQRRVVEFHLAGLSGSEIASVLGRSPAAVRAIQSRAVSRLRELLVGGLSEVEPRRRR